MKGPVRELLLKGWVWLCKILPFESLSRGGVRGFEINISKLVFYTVKSPQKQLIDFELISDNGDWGLMVMVPGRAFVFYAEKR